MDMKSVRNKRWTEIDRTKQFILVVLVKDLKRLHKHRLDDRLRWTRIVYSKGANKDKLVVYHLFWTRARFKPCYNKDGSLHA